MNAHWIQINGFKIPVFLFTLLLFFQMVTGFLLFDIHIGWDKTSVLTFYKISEGFQQPQSFERFLETASPHLLSMGLISFLVIHFLAFTPQVSSKTRWWLGCGLGSFTLLNIFAGAVILWLGAWLYWLKIASFIGFQFFFLAGALVIFQSLISEDHSQSAN